MSQNALKKLSTYLSKTKNILALFLLGGWSFFQYRHENEIYAIATIVVFAILSLPRFRNFTLIAVSVFVILVSEMPTAEMVTDIKTANLNAYTTFKSSLNTILSPNTGTEVLPKRVRQMLELITVHSIPDYRLSDSVFKDTLIRHRITESAWPIKTETTSHYLFLFTYEKADYQECNKIDRREDILLAYCP